MKQFRCTCGNQVFFDNTSCLRCGNAIGFDPQRFDFVVFQGAAQAGAVADGQRHCRNRIEHNVCNWVLPAASSNDLCRSCALNGVIPALDVDDNRVLWARLEQAKRRLLYSLLRGGLPLEPDDGRSPLRFNFMEDQRRNPDVEQAFIATGHHLGTITINLTEADDVARTEIREQMREQYRTLLGHFRHEAGHYYFSYLVGDPGDAEFVGLFGDVTQDYAQAMATYYKNGAAPDWQSHFVSAYASAHTHEDWAECFAHYLHITQTLETADWALPAADEEQHWLDRWTGLALGINELNRSLGAPPPYPFFLSEKTRAKLRYVNRRMRQRGGFSV